jgi:hypothetical protein
MPQFLENSTTRLIAMMSMTGDILNAFAGERHSHIIISQPFKLISPKYIPRKSVERKKVSPASDINSAFMLQDTNVLSAFAPKGPYGEWSAPDFIACIGIDC